MNYSRVFTFWFWCDDDGKKIFGGRFVTGSFRCGNKIAYFMSVHRTSPSCRKNMTSSPCCYRDPRSIDLLTVDTANYTHPYDNNEP